MKTQVATIIVSVLILGILTFVTKANAQDTFQYTESNMVNDEVQLHIIKMYRGRIDMLFANTSEIEGREAITQRLVDMPRCAALRVSLAIGAPDEYWRRKYTNDAAHYENHHVFHIFALRRTGTIDNSEEMVRAYFEGGFRAVYDNDITPLIAGAQAGDPADAAGLEDLVKRCNFYAEDISRLNTDAQAKVGPPETQHLADDLEFDLEDEE